MIKLVLITLLTYSLNSHSYLCRPTSNHVQDMLIECLREVNSEQGKQYCFNKYQPHKIKLIHEEDAGKDRKGCDGDRRFKVNFTGNAYSIWITEIKEHNKGSLL